MSIVLVNTNLAAAAGVVVAILVSRPILGRTDLFAVLNGAIAGLVSITAAPNFVDHYWAIIIGAIGGLIVVSGLRLLERLKIDDVVGAVPAHLFAGIWGTLAASIAGGAQFHIQLLGVVVVGVTVFSISWSAWKVLDKTPRRAGVQTGGAVGTGRRRAPHGVLPGVRPHAGHRLLR